MRSFVACVAALLVAVGGCRAPSKVSEQSAVAEPADRELDRLIAALDTVRGGFQWAGEVVFFVAATPTHSAAATALGQWVDKTAIIVLDDDSSAVEQTASAMSEAGAHVTEVVWA